MDDMTSSGFVIGWREELNIPVLKDPNVFYFWNICKANACYREYKQKVGGKIITLKPGQFIFSRRKFAEKYSLSERQIRTCIKQLKIDPLISVEATHKYSIITVLNWELWSVKGYEATHKKQKERPSSDPVATQSHNNDDNKVNKVKQKNQNSTIDNSQNAKDMPKDSPPAGFFQNDESGKPSISKLFEVINFQLQYTEYETEKFDLKKFWHAMNREGCMDKHIMYALTETSNKMEKREPFDKNPYAYARHIALKMMRNESEKEFREKEEQANHDDLKSVNPEVLKMATNLTDTIN